MFKARRNLAQEIIDVDSQKCKRKRQRNDSKLKQHCPRQPKSWINNHLYSLMQSDRDVLLNITGWLNDDIVSAAQRLLKQMFPLGYGFQDTCLGMTYSFTIEYGEFIQVLHNGHNHWLTISTIGAKKDEVFIYDSLYNSVSTKVKTQIAALLAAKGESIKLSFVNVQKQSGGCDCGLFALAFATALVNGTNPGTCFFNQGRMRRHLYQCLTQGKMEQFPMLKSNGAEAKINSEDIIKVYCSCRMPEVDGIDMVQCNQCQEWFHLGCVAVLDEAMSDSATEWFCPTCA